MPVTIYHNPRCNTSRKTLALLRDKGIEPEVVEYLKTPYTAAQLKQLLAQMKLPAKAVVRKKEAAEGGNRPEAVRGSTRRGDGQQPNHRRAADRRLGRQGGAGPPAGSGA
jgi:glutaredoxin